MSVIEQMLSAHRLVGGVVFDAVMRGEWSMLSQFDVQHCARYFRVPERIVAYHYVRRGMLTCVLPDAPPLTAAAGTMVLFPRNDAHVICSSPTVPPTPAEQIFAEAHLAPNLVRVGREGPECAIYCGWLGVDDSATALIDALPPMLTASAGDGASGSFFSSSLRYAAEELHTNPELVAKLSQMFFEEAVRRYLETVPPEEERRLAALRDPAIGRALAMLEGEDNVSLDAVARAAGLSRTVLSERFAALFGESPMRYRARRRLVQAATRLAESDASLADIAYSAGFQSEEAFSRAFKRAYGTPPGAWREAQRESSRSPKLAGSAPSQRGT